MSTTTSFQLLNKDLKSMGGSVLVTFSRSLSQKDKAEKSVHLSFPGLAQSLAQSIEDKNITGKALETCVFRELKFQGYRHVVVVGTGTAKDFDHEVARQAFAAAFDAIKSLNTKEAFIDFDSLGAGKKDLSACAKAAAEGLVLASYVFDDCKSKKKEKDSSLLIHVVTSKAADKVMKTSFSEGLVLADVVNFSRNLGDTPGNLMTPTILAERTQEAAKGSGLRVTVWDKARIKKEKMGGLLGVSLGSDQEPRFIIMEYNGAAKSKQPIVFVGKGLTFDSGGISIKPSAAMEEMKYDMCGGANVIGTMLAIARLKLKVNVMGLVPATENMPGPSANKPGDICFARNGKSFEVNNTDAEGRLILSDALCYASEQKPAMIVDAATLTGAMVVALGNTHTGFFTRNQDLKNKIKKASEASGEWTWQMPLCDFHVKDMKGTFADLSNMSSGKGAGSATAAAFLEQFVAEGIPWAHFDIAGTGWAVGNRLNYCPKKGASGVMIRTFVELARLYA